MSRGIAKKKFSAGAPFDPSRFNARETMAALKDNLGAPAMHWANQTAKLVQPQKFQPIVEQAQDLLQHGAVLDAERDRLNLRGRSGALITAWADSRSNAGSGALSKAKQRLPVTQTIAGEETPKDVSASVAELADPATPPVTPSVDDDADLDGGSKGLLLVVAFGAALAAVLLAFK